MYMYIYIYLYAEKHNANIYTPHALEVLADAKYMLLMLLLCCVCCCRRRCHCCCHRRHCHHRLRHLCHHPRHRYLKHASLICSFWDSKMPQTCFAIPKEGVCRVCRRRYHGIFVIFLGLDLDNFSVWLRICFQHQEPSGCCTTTVNLHEIPDCITDWIHSTDPLASSSGTQ